jgi:hypothetical protein
MTPTTLPTQGGDGWAGWTVWGAGLVVASGAGIATAHGLYEVALAAGTPRGLAWLYPLITDGLALVAYATTTRLSHHGRRYAWTVVVTAAGLSGLTQASYLAGGVATAPPALRFAIGAWPALAAATVAHLLYLLATTGTLPASAPQDSHRQLPQPGHLGSGATPDPEPSQPTGVPSSAPASGPNEPLAGANPRPAPTTGLNGRTSANPPEPLPVPTVDSARVLPPPAFDGPPPLPAALLNHAGALPNTPDARSLPSRVVQRLNTPLNAAPPVEQHLEHPPDTHKSSAGRASTAPAADRALTLARDHAARHGQLPTVTELVTLARVGRGTAAAALKTLRQPSARQPTAKAASNARSDQ